MRFVWVIMLALVGLAPAPSAVAAERQILANPKAAIGCQNAITKASTTFVAKKLKLLDACAGAIYACIETVPEDLDAVVDPLERCLEKANTKCVKASEKIAKEETALVGRITEGCAGLDPLDFMRAEGVGFSLLADECAGEFGVTPVDAATAAECVMLQQECQVERLFQAAHPRAGELFAYTEADIGTSCLDDLGGGGSVPDPKIGKTLAKCGQDVRKASAAFAVRKVRGMSTCASEVFACVQNDVTDLDCLGKAQKACDKELAGIEAEALKLEPAYMKGCGKIAFGNVAPETGLFTDASAEECETYGILFVGTLSSYKNCVHRNHECQGDELVRFVVPRAAEMLAIINRPFPNKFFCTEDEPL